MIARISSQLIASQIHPQVVDWVGRVKLNGGSQPSSKTVTAVNRFYIKLVQNDLLTKMKSVCCLVPDNLIASITPLIRGVGNNPWTNMNFVASDLTVNGLVGNGTSKYLKTGIIPNSVFSDNNSAGLTLYIHTGGNYESCDIGATDALWTNSFELFVDYSDGYSYFDCYALSGGRISGSNSAWTGFLSGNRTASNATIIYKANSSTALTTVASGSNAPTQVRPSYEIYCFALDVANALSAPLMSARRLSFAAIHLGLSQAEANKFYSYIQALRTELGGGYV